MNRVAVLTQMFAKVLNIKVKPVLGVILNRASLALFVVYALLLNVLLPSSLAQAAAPPPQTLKVIPIVECVEDHGDGNFTAWFGYNNPNSTTINVPRPLQNSFLPPPLNRNQPTAFLPGRQKYVFSVTQRGDTLIWELNLKVAIALRTRSPRCPNIAVEIDQPTDGVVINGESVTVRGHAYSLTRNGGGIASVTVNQRPALYTATDKSWSINNLPLAEGANTVTARATDAAGNVQEKSISVVRRNIVTELTSVEPNRAVQGQTVQVMLHGRNTHWTATQTRASFGGETQVGGAAAGELGLITVINETTATADVAVSPTAALAPRTVRVATQLSNNQTEEVSLENALTVAPITTPGASANNVTTIAGFAGSPGFSDGIGAAAQFRDLAGIAVAANDTIYVADAGNNRIRLVRREILPNNTTDWVTHTLAGDGTPGFADGAAEQARFNNPQGVAVATDGTIFVADAINNRIRRIAPDGTVSTLAGDGTAGLQDGTGNSARFNNPRGVALDNVGNILVADTGNAAVRRIDASGQVATLAGDGTVGSNESPNAHFNGLAGVAVNNETVYVYLADGGNNRIRRLDASGTTVTIAGAERGFADGSATDARFAKPTGIAMDASGRLIVADTINSLIRALALDLAANNSPQAVTTAAGSGIRGSLDGNGAVAQFNLPRGIAVSQSSAIIVADTGNHIIRRIGLPPRINSFSPVSGRPGASVTIYGENFDGRGTDKNTIKFAKAGGGQTTAQVTAATKTQITVTVPADAATGRITVATGDGTATSETNFTVENNPAPSIADFNPRRGQVGNTVTLVGTALKADVGNPLVTFAGSNGTRLSALVQTATATIVSVMVPNGAVTGNIELVNAWGRAVSPAAFVVDESQAFALTVAPATIQAVARTSGTAVVSLNSNNQSFTQLAALSATDLPANVTATFEPANITAGATSTLRLNLVNAAVSSGSYSFKVKAAALIDGREVIKEASATLSVLAAGQTTLTGRVLNTDSEPVVGATASLDGRTATTDASGSFTLSGITAGTARPLQIDGRTASAPNRTYPVITEPANIVAGQANQIPYTFFLPPIDIQNEVTIVPGQTAVVTTPKVPGVSVTIPANANLRNRDGSPITRVSITSLPIDRTPTPLPANVTTGIVFTIQPGGALSDVPMPVIFPNTLGNKPGERATLYAFDHDNVRWYIFGYGRVSGDGKTIVPEINPATGNPYGITNFSWYFSSPDTGPDGNPRGGPGGSGGGGDCGASPRGSNPVDFSTGMKIESATDIGFVGSRGGLGLERTYTSELGSRGIAGRFGIGTKDNYDFKLSGSFVTDGSGFLITPEDVQGRLFSYTGYDANGNLYFKSGTVMQFKGDVIIKRTDGRLEFRRANGSILNFYADSGSTFNYHLGIIVDRNGNATTLNYSGDKLIQITDSVGRSINLSYGQNGYISSATDPKTHTWNYGYDSGGRLTSVVDPLSRSFGYLYNSGNLLTDVFASDGKLIKHLTYLNRRVTKQEFENGGFESYAYTVSGSLVTNVDITSPQGRITSKRFNGNGYVIEMKDPYGQLSRIERDVQNFPVASSGPCGCTEQTRQFDSQGNPTAITDRLGKTVNVQYEPVFNRVTSVRDKLGREAAMTYDDKGNLKVYKDQMNYLTQMSYDSYGQLKEIKDPADKVTQMEYDQYGYISAQVDKLGKRWTYDHDVIGNLISATDPLGRRTSYVYDNANRVTLVNDANNATTTYTYDTNSNLIKVTDSLNREWKMKYDSMNRMTETTDPLNRKTRFGYNNDNDLLSVTSASGRIVRYFYDARGQTIKTVDATNQATEFSYDYRGSLASLKDERGFVTTFVYDELKRLIASRNPLGETASTVYNEAGEISKNVDALGRETAYQYDALSRTTTINYPDAQVNYTYDSRSRLTQIDDSQGGTIGRAYDDRGSVLSETTANGTVNYTYNDAGQRASMSVPGNANVNYNYDAAGRLNKIAQGAEEFVYGYDQLSRLTSMTRPNSVRTDYAYDTVNRLERMVHTDGAGQKLEDYRYAYNINDEIAAITTLRSANASSTPKNSSVPDAANRVAQFGNASYGFDRRGENTTKTVAGAATQYNWDGRGRLTEAVLPSGERVGYSYDAMGRRAATTGSSGTTKYLYDGADVVQDADTATGNKVEYLNGGVDNKLRVNSQTTGSLYFLPDHLGSTQGLTDAAGAVVEWQRYTPYGEAANSSVTRYGYTGREFDQKTGLLFLRNRWYDPAQGRFISEDPKGQAGGTNLYEYAGGNPISNSDRFGLDWRTDWRDGYAAFNQAQWQFEQNLINASAPLIEGIYGFGDNASGGLTRYLRQWQGLDVPGIECSGWYKAGEWTSFGIQVAEGGLGLYELGGKFALRRALKEGVEEFGDDAARAAKNCIMCFEAGTQVQTDKGLKSIERIRKGDRVLSYNEQTGKNEYQPVTQTFTRIATDVWQLKVEGELASIGVTSEHPFFVRVHGARSHISDDGEWKQTWQIRAGDEIRLKSGRWARVLSNLPKGEARVYNFTVEQNHNYFVGKLRLLTHNVNCISDILSKASKVEGRYESTLEDGTKVIFRKDVGVDAHPIGSKYPNPVDHYNIEVHAPGRTPGRFKQAEDFHIIIDGAKNAIDIIH